MRASHQQEERDDVQGEVRSFSIEELRVGVAQRVDVEDVGRTGRHERGGAPKDPGRRGAPPARLEIRVEGRA